MTEDLHRNCALLVLSFTFSIHGEASTPCSFQTMPGVALQPNSPTGLSGFGSASHSSKCKSLLPSQCPPKVDFGLASLQNGSRFYDGMSVAEIKAKAKESVSKEARGASAITLIKTARTQILSAKEHEAKGDLRSALGTYIKAATLAKMTMDSPEYVQESRGKGAGGVIRKELNDFLEVHLKILCGYSYLQTTERRSRHKCAGKCCGREAEGH